MTVNFLFIIPTLNSYFLLPTLIKSLKQQTYQNWRLIFVDGCSETDHIRWLDTCCAKEKRCSWIKQNPKEKGIYGAMNSGFEHAKTDEWILFWGSDDWAATSTILEEIKNELEDILKKDNTPDLIFTKAKYINKENKIKRTSQFNFVKNMKISMFLGGSPPHQSTLFGNGARKLINRYSSKYRIAGDLDYFCKISKFKKIKIKLINKYSVLMLNEGVSQKENSLKLKEVLNIYKEQYGIAFFIPFIIRYLKRIYSILKKS